MRHALRGAYSMSEIEPKSSEVLSVRDTAELAELAAEKRLSPEASQENGEHKQAKIELARAQVEQQSVEPVAFEEKAPPAKHHITRYDKLVAYRQTVKSLQNRLTPTSRKFSQIIHQPSVEKTSEVLGKTIFRPSVTLGATFTAVIFESILYFAAKHYGFALRGSEIILALIVGAVIGLAIEALAKITSRR